MDKRLSTTYVEGRPKRTFSQIAQTFKGVPQALLAVLLDMAYKLQVLSGLDPGVEFAHPIRTYHPSTIFCGDAPASETIQRLYRVFVTPLQSVHSSLDAVKTLFARVFRPPYGGINFPAVIFLDYRRLREFAQLTFSTALIGLSLVLLGSAASFAFESALATNSIPKVTTTFTSSLSLFDLIREIGQIFSLCYVIVSTLNFLKVLILDRDSIIADRIVEITWRQACIQRRPITVCAVVGLLHVNGILQLLQDGQHEE